MNEIWNEESLLYPNFTAEIRHIERFGVSSDIIKRIMNKQQYKERHMKDLYKRYKTTQDGVPIFHREFEQVDAINNKINNDYFSEIVNTKVGYFAGSPFSYSYSQVKNDEVQTYNKPTNVFDRFTNMVYRAFSTNSETTPATATDIEKNDAVLKHFIAYNNIADLDMELTKIAEICGYCGRLMYIDTNGEEAVTIVEPYECIILSRKEITEPEYALRYYDVEVERDGIMSKVRKVEFYDAQNIYFFEEGADGFNEDADVPNPVMPHLFDFCPLQGIPNNREMMGGAEKVLAQIDAIDRTISDCNSEVESFKLAYMLIIGARIEDEELQKARVTGAFNLPAFGEGVDIKYLTKDINDTFIENHLNRLDEYIYKFSQTPDMSNPMNENTSGIN